MSTFLFHPPGITVKIIGKDCGRHGRSCYAHYICGSLITLDVVVRFQRFQILDNGKEVGHCSLPCNRWDCLLLCWLSQKRADKVQQPL